MTLIQRVNALATAIGAYIKNSILPRLLPAGGTTGQVLFKTSATNYAAGWTDKNANFGFEQVSVLPTTNLYQGRIVDLQGGGGLYKYFEANVSLGIVADWYPIISNNGLDDSSQRWYIGANEAQIYQAFSVLNDLTNAIVPTMFSLIDLNISVGSGAYPVNATVEVIANFGSYERLRAYRIINTASARSVIVTSPGSGLQSTTVPLATGDILIPRFQSSNSSWTYEVVPAPVVDTDYVSIFNTALV